MRSGDEAGRPSKGQGLDALAAELLRADDLDQLRLQVCVLEPAPVSCSRQGANPGATIPRGGAMKALTCAGLVLATFAIFAMFGSYNARAGKAIYHTAPSNCGSPKTCGYYDFDQSSGGYTYFNVQEYPGTYLRAVQCCDGHTHNIWLAMNWGPPGCFKTSNYGTYYNSNLNTYNAGVLALVNYSCSGSAAGAIKQANAELTACSAVPL